MIEVEFPDNFMPPEEFHVRPVGEKKDPPGCEDCPFFQWDDYGGYCGIADSPKCPIRKFFVNSER